MLLPGHPINPMPSLSPHITPQARIDLNREPTRLQVRRRAVVLQLAKTGTTTILRATGIRDQILRTRRWTDPPRFQPCIHSSLRRPALSTSHHSQLPPPKSSLSHSLNKLAFRSCLSLVYELPPHELWLSSLTVSLCVFETYDLAFCRGFPHLRLFSFFFPPSFLLSLSLLLDRIPGLSVRFILVPLNVLSGPSSPLEFRYRVKCFKYKNRKQESYFLSNVRVLSMCVQILQVIRRAESQNSSRRLLLPLSFQSR